MPIQPSAVPDFRRSVAAEFLDRPTLRSVLSQQVLELLVPWHAALAGAGLPDAEALILNIPAQIASGPQTYDAWTPRPLLEVMLEALHARQPLASLGADGGDFLLAVREPWFLRDQAGNPLPFGTISIGAQMAALDDLLLMLADRFCQAQVDFWKAPGSQGVSRDLWLQHLLKRALLHNLPLQGLDQQQRQCLLSLLKNHGATPAVFLVQVQLDDDVQWLPNLLVSGEWDEREVFLWCAPSSLVKAFDSLDLFAEALRAELAEHQRFKAMVWHRYELEGDVFAQQSSLLLEIMLDDIARLRYAELPEGSLLETGFAALSDPARWFIEGYGQASDAQIPLPPGLRHGSAANGFAYQRGVFELALAQAQSEGVGALDDVLDLRSFTRRELRTQMLVDFPLEANYFPDDLLLHLPTHVGWPGGAGVGPGGWTTEPHRMSLTEFAIGNLWSLHNAQLTAITHRENQLIMDWMNVDYVKSLVQRVDIGKHYPIYVAQKLDDPATQPERIKRFGREWRCSLLFSALYARMQGELSDAGLQCVTDFCHGYLDPQLPALMLMPLAFKRGAGEVEPDTVSGMYVLFATEPARVLLYRPLYSAKPLLEFASLDLMMDAIRRPGPLQDSILAWMPSASRAVYAYGGFYEPHWSGPILDSQLLPARGYPPTFAAQFWRDEVDARLYKANRDLLVELADRESVSNAESRWAILVQGAWLLFDVVTLILRGPVASVAWLVQAIAGLHNDLSALRDGSAFERSTAVVNVLLNACMALMHLRLPQFPLGEPVRNLPRRSAMPALGDAEALVAPVQGKVAAPGVLAQHGSTRLDFSWRGTQGFNVLSPQQRTVVFGLRVEQSLEGLEPLAEGPGRGLYRVGEHYYLTLGDGVYRATFEEQGLRMVGADGAMGPWLAFEHGQWRVDRGLRLRGGMPRSRLEALKEENRKKAEQLKNEEAELARHHNALAETLNRHRDLLNEKDERIAVLEAVTEPDELTLRELELTRRLRKQINLKIIYEVKGVVEASLKHEQVVNSLYNMRHDDAAYSIALTAQRSLIRQSLIENMSIFYNEMAMIINAEDLENLAQQLVIHPESEAEISQYLQFRSALEQVIKWEVDLVDMSRLLDTLLEETLKDDTFVFRNEDTQARINKDHELKSTIEARRLSAIDLDFRLLQDLAEASLERRADVEERVLSQYLDYLAGDSLKSAGNAHGDLAGSELSLAERIEVLTGILEGYEEAAAMADYLGSVGGAAIRQESLQLYKKTLHGLQRAAQGDLAQAVREHELSEPAPPRPTVYAPRGGRRQLVRTHRGRKVLAQEVEVDGVALVQQRDERTQHVLKTFHQRGGEWVEDAPQPTESEPPFSPLEPRLARKRAQALLAEVERIIKLARSFFQAEQPNSLATVIDGHLDKMRNALSTLPRMSPEDALFESLGEGIERLQATRRDLLTGIYLSTDHPDARSLQFLLDNHQVTVQRAGPRKALAAGDYLDVYEVRRQPRAGQVQGDGLWEAHFHYPDIGTPGRQFSKGHLKLWAQRKLGRLAQLRAATSGEDLVAIYRGDLRLAQVEGLIPFD
ncbi:dermonecrotic toxin domain-containing protein [Pseudomonas sp. NPDC089758]|uniref:dermonecrotic toxin domain-containing protein n=1 Tax=Pseudomonas sp. NPDC089758 TaxID=3364473 RepID=UPI003801B2AC